MSSAQYLLSLGAPKDKKPWMMETHLKFNVGKKSFYEQKIADFFDASNVEYLYKWPVWKPKEKRSFFVDFYLPEYSLLVDIETKKESPYYDEEHDEARKQLLSSIKGMRYFIVKRRDLCSDDFKDKVHKAMSSRRDYKMRQDRKRIKSQDEEKITRGQKMTKHRKGE